MLARDFNHPSVVIWSIGNEIPERAKPAGLEIGRNLVVACVRSVDSRRPVTNAICSFLGQSGVGRAVGPLGPGLRAPRLSAATITARTIMKATTPNFLPGSWPARSRFSKGGLRILDARGKASLRDRRLRVDGMDHLGESGIGHTTYVDDASAGPGPQPWGLMPGRPRSTGAVTSTSRKQETAILLPRRGLGPEQIELAVHAPVPEGKHELTSLWGWPDELQSWNWAAARARRCWSTCIPRLPGCASSSTTACSASRRSIPRKASRPASTCPTNGRPARQRARRRPRSSPPASCAPAAQPSPSQCCPNCPGRRPSAAS